MSTSPVLTPAAETDPLSLHLAAPNQTVTQLPKFYSGIKLAANSAIYADGDIIWDLNGQTIRRLSSGANIVWDIYDSLFYDNSNLMSIDYKNRLLYASNGYNPELVTFDWQNLKLPTFTTDGILCVTNSDGTIALDSNTYLTAETDPLSVHLDQTSPQTTTGIFHLAGLDSGTDGGDVYLGSTGGTLGFYGLATSIAKPSGSVITALSNLGLITSPTISDTEITITGNNPIMMQVFS